MTPGGLGCGVSVDSGGESLRVGGEISSLAGAAADHHGVDREPWCRDGMILLAWLA